MALKSCSCSAVAILAAPTNIATSLVVPSFVGKAVSGFEAAPASGTTAIDLLMAQPIRTRLALSCSTNHALYEPDGNL